MLEKTYTRKPKLRYTQIVAVIFISCTLASSVGIVILNNDYFSVFDTANRFIPRVTRFTKSPEGPGDSRNLTLYLNLANTGSRRILFIRDGDPTRPTNIEVRIDLNGRFVTSQEIRPDLVLLPGSDLTLVINFTVEDGLGDNRVTSILEDREGNLWLGTYAGGVSRLIGASSPAAGANFINSTIEDGLADNRITSILEDREGYLWFGTHSGASRYDRGRLVTFSTEDGLAQV